MATRTSHTSPDGADVGGWAESVYRGRMIHAAITDVTAVVVYAVVKNCHCRRDTVLPNGRSIEQPLGSKQAVDGQITELTSDFFNTHTLSAMLVISSLKTY